MSQEKKQEQGTAAIESPADDRRGFLTKSTMLLAALGMTELVLPDGAHAALTREQVGALKKVMDTAMSTASMERALATDAGKMLPRDAQAALKILTATDLRAAAQLHSKLAKIAGMVAADNNGYVGM